MWFNVYIPAPSLYRLTVLLETDIIMSGFEQRRVLFLESPTSNVGIIPTFKMIVTVERSILKME